MQEELNKALENKEISLKDDPKVLAQTLVNQFGWDPSDCKKIWCFGPEETGPNALVDCTKGVPYMNELKDHMKSAFQWAT